MFVKICCPIFKTQNVVSKNSIDLRCISILFLYAYASTEGGEWDIAALTDTGSLEILLVFHRVNSVLSRTCEGY